VVGSDFARRQLATELGCRTDHVSVVPYGVDERFAPRPRRPDLVARYGLDGAVVALFFGGLKPRKNLPLLLDVFARVAPAAPAARLLIAGGGSLRETLERRARALGLGDRIVFTGYVPEAEKVDHFNLADVFVFPSALEGFGLAVGEAMSCGLPVLASDRGSIPEIVGDGESGLLADPAAPERFAERLAALLADAGLRQGLGRAGRARVEARFRWDRCVAATAAVYEATLAAWRRPAAAR
jgi:phosphatidylinositol alpha-1,6-mannosyltransferase